MAMISLELAKQNLEIETANTDFNDLLEDIIIPTICADAESFMGLKYSAITGHTEYLDGGMSQIFLEYANVSNLSLYVDANRSWGEVYDSDNYSLYANRGKVIKNSGMFPHGNKIIKAVYGGGYAEDSLPADLQGKLLKQIAYEFRRRKDLGMSAVTYPDGTINKIAIGEWLPDVESVLRRYGRYGL
jgi:hypothetical protein